MPLLSTSITIYAVLYYGFSLLPNKFENRTRPEFILSPTSKGISVLTHHHHLLQAFKHTRVKHPSSQTSQSIQIGSSNYDVTLDDNCYLLNPPDSPQSWRNYDPVLYFGSSFNSITTKPIFLRFLPRIVLPPISSSYLSEMKVNQNHNSKDIRLQESAYSTSIDRTPIVIDTGATFGTTPFVDDLIPGTMEPVKSSVNNLSGKSDITARGFGRWHVKDVKGVTAIIEPFLQVVPNSNVRLMSPQDYFRGLKGGSYLVTPDSTYLTLPNGVKLEVPYHHSNNLPMLFTSRESESRINYLNFDDLDDSAVHFNVLDERNQNLTASEREFLFKHKLLSHGNFAWNQELMRDRHYVDDSGSNAQLPPVIRTQYEATKSCKHHRIKCAGCLLATMKRRPDEASHTKNRTEMKLKENKLYPGQLVHSDQYESSVGGRAAQTYGKEKEIDKYKGGTIFCDSMSTYIHINHQTTLQAGDTLTGKHEFEDFAHSIGVTIESYRGDNHIFNSKAYKQDCADLNQSIDFCGVGAHHQNGVAERAIQTVTNWARTLLIDAAIHWPDEVDLDLWPFAMDHAVWMWNNTPKQNVGFSPTELFTGVRSDHSALNRLHVWGCPTYVLEPALQVGGGAKIPKWNKRSRLGQFLGFSKEHSTKVGLVRNVQTGGVSPQFHAVYDDAFSTVCTMFQDPQQSLDQVFSTKEWTSILANGVEKYFPPDAEPPPLDPQWQSTDTDQERARRNLLLRQFQERNPLDNTVQRERADDDNSTIATEKHFQEESTSELNVEMPSIFDGADVDEITVSKQPSIIESSVSTPNTPKSTTSNDNQSSERAPKQASVDDISPAIDKSPLPTRRSKRIRKKGKMIWYDDKDLPEFEYDPRAFVTQKVRGSVLNCAFLNSLDWSLKNIPGRTHWKNFSAYILRHMDKTHRTWEVSHPLLLSAKANSADNPKWFEAMNGPYSDQFNDAAREEIETLENIDAWTKIKRANWMNVLKSTWVFKIKRFPNGLIRKFKGRFRVRGDMQVEGIDFDETFAPVVNWITIRTLLVLSQKLRLSTAQLDYTAAFPQSVLNEDVYVEMPRGFRENGYVLKLKKSLYGLRQSPRNFFAHLSGQLTQLGFVPSSADPCLFIKKGCICITYVDDILVFAKNNQIIEQLMNDLTKLGADLKKENDVAGFLGVDITTNDDNTITMTQTGLIDRIITTMGLENANPKETPAKHGTLPKDAQGEDCNEDFNYASVVGMLLYLEGHSRPDISFAVNQCSRYTFAPKRSHEEAIKHIGRYLKGTRDKGITLKPTKDLKIDCFVDADFAGLWGYEDDQDPTSVRSRSGFLFIVGGCVISWSTKLQTEIALSTMESEYIAMSMAMKELIPLRRTVIAICEGLELSTDLISSIQSDVWEDNAGALALAKLEPPRMTPRSKHYSIKYHWFREFINSDSIVLKKLIPRPS